MKINNKFNLKEALKNPENCPVCKKDGKKWVTDRWVKHRGKIKLHAEYICLFCNANITDIFVLENITVVGKST